MAVSDDFRVIASALDELTVWAWKTSEETAAETVLRGCTSFVYSVALSTDGSGVASRSDDEAV